MKNIKLLTITTICVLSIGFIGNADAACDGDINADGSVDVVDLLDVLAGWGPCDGACPADINGDGSVDVVDLLALLAAWGTCGGIEPAMIEDFEGGGAWPWAPWVKPAETPFEHISADAAHDGAAGLADVHYWTYRTDTTFGNTENEVLAAWCVAGVDDPGRCALGFGADTERTYALKIETYADKIEFIESEYALGAVHSPLVTTYVPIEQSTWYKLEIHTLGNGLFEGRVYAADGVTLVGSVLHDFGTLPGTGVAIWGTSNGYLDTVQTYAATGDCLDNDGDGVCNADDQCEGDDASGDSDSDGICDDIDLCIGLDILGDANGDGYCDGHVCAADTPAFYDQTGSAVDWAAGGTCVEKAAANGPPACPQSEWAVHVDNIELIQGLYPFTAAVFDAQAGGGQAFSTSPYTIICENLPGDPALDEMFADLNDCYHGNTDWMFNFSMAIIHFDWGVNPWRMRNYYSARAALFGGSCSLDPLVGMATGFHGVNDSPPFTYWTVRATEDCDYYGCRCYATLKGWADDIGNFFLDTITNSSGPKGPPGEQTDCSDPRFDF